MRSLLASLMAGYKRNRRAWRSRALHCRKMSNELHGDPGRSRRKIINRLSVLKASKECGVFRRTGSQEEPLKVPLHLQMLGRGEIICAKGKPVPVVHRSILCNTPNARAPLSRREGDLHIIGVIRPNRSWPRRRPCANDKRAGGRISFQADDRMSSTGAAVL